MAYVWKMGSLNRISTKIKMSFQVDTNWNHPQVLPFFEDSDLPGRSLIMIPHLNCKWLQRQRPLLKPSSSSPEQSRYYRSVVHSFSPFPSPPWSALHQRTLNYECDRLGKTLESFIQAGRASNVPLSRNNSLVHMIDSYPIFQRVPGLPVRHGGT